MATMLKAVTEFAVAYSDHYEQTLLARAAAPSGTSIRVTNFGPNDIYGNLFGKLGNLLLFELFRAAPERTNGVGYFRLPFSKMPPLLSTDPSAFPGALDETRAAHRMILADVSSQIAILDGRDLAAFPKKTEAA
jgi:hypothetical protein